MIPSDNQKLCIFKGSTNFVRTEPRRTTISLGVSHLGLHMAQRASFDQTQARLSSLPNSGQSSLKLPGAASLYEQLDKLILVCLRDGRNFLGYLRSFDQYANLVLDKTVERLVVEDSFADAPVGLFVVRGENVMLLGEVDDNKEAHFEASMKQVSESEIRRALAALEEDRQALRRGDKLEWPIPEEY